MESTNMCTHIEGNKSLVETKAWWKQQLGGNGSLVKNSFKQKLGKIKSFEQQLYGNNSLMETTALNNSYEQQL